MDDTWGSPWADETVTIQDPAPIKRNVSPYNSEAVQKPFKVIGFQEDSPWCNADDGFGDWADDGTKQETNLAVLPPYLDSEADSGTKRAEAETLQEEPAQRQFLSGNSLSALSPNVIKGIGMSNGHKEILPL